MKWISFTFLFFLLIPGEFLKSSPLDYSTEIINSADSLYSKKSYKKALKQYLEISKSKDYIFNDPKFDFKLAHCYFQNGQYIHANNVFAYSELLSDFLPEYTKFLQFKTLLLINNDQKEIENFAAEYLKKYNNHFLADSVISLLASYYFDNRKYENALDYYSKLYRRNSKYKKSTYISKQVAIINYELGKTEIAMDKMQQILKKYPGSKDAFEIVQFIQERRIDTEELFFPIIEVYLSHEKVKYLNNKLEAFIAATDDLVVIEKARYYLYRIYFLKGEYHTALQGFLNLYKNSIDEKLTPKILVYIARTYLQLNDKEKSAETYIEYSNKYPRRRLAPECAWKAAWIYEEINNLEKALEQYQAVQKHWLRNSFRYEAKFREALTLYRMGNYLDAALIFREIISSRWDSIQKNRAKYWLALTYNKLGRTGDADVIFLELGKNVFQDFYTTKAYLRKQSSLDSILFATDNNRISENPLEVYISSIVYNNEKFTRLFLINELMGMEYVLNEINRKEYKPHDLGGWVAQAEIYKKLGDYNNAYKIYDMIDYTYFPDYDILEKPFILKEKYPFYFDAKIGEISAQRKLDKYFILAIIRAESGFDKNAHSWANAYGLMQIIPRTAKELAREINLDFSNPEDLFEEEINLNLGIYYVSKLAKQYDNQKEYILAAYNAGPHRVSRWKKYNNNETLDFLAENIEFMQTRDYVKKVLKNYWIYSILDEKY